MVLLSKTKSVQSKYVILPRRLWLQSKKQKAQPTLTALRNAVSEAWRGQGVVAEIRQQREK